MSEENQNDYDFIEGQENAEEKDRCLVCLDSDPNAKIRGLSAPVPPQSSVPLDEGSTCPISAATYLDGNLLGLLLLSGSLPFVRVVEFVSGETLMRLRMLCKAWRVSVDGLIDSMVSSGEMLVHGGNDIIGEGAANLRTEKRALVLEVVFLLNITKVGEMACWSAINLVVVEIPEGVKRIGYSAFASCVNLTTVAFPKTLLIIEGCAFMNCVSLENVDLLHTNLQFIGPCVFRDCCQLSSMTLPDSLKISNLDGGMKTVAPHVFLGCTAIAPSHIDVFGGNAPYDVKKGQFSDMNPNNIDNKHDATLAIIAHLRSVQQTVCAVVGCFKPGTKTCAACLEVHYCSAEHQKQHWKSHHKKVCVTLPDPLCDPGLGRIASRRIFELKNE